MILKILRALGNQETFTLTVINGKYTFISRNERKEVTKKDLGLFNKALMVVVNQLQFELEDELSNGPHYD